MTEAGMGTGERIAANFAIFFLNAAFAGLYLIGQHWAVWCFVFGLGAQAGWTLRTLAQPGDSNG